jgi:hypothetical protein
MYKNYVDVIVNKLANEDFNAYYYKNYKEIYLNNEEKESLKEYILCEVTNPNVIYFDISKGEAHEFLIKYCINNVEGGKTQIFIMEFTGEPVKIEYESIYLVEDGKIIRELNNNIFMNMKQQKRD